MYCKHFLIGLLFPGFFELHIIPLTLLKNHFVLSFLIKMSLYYPMTKRIKFKLSVAFKVLPQLVKTHFSQTEYLIYMFMFLTLHLLKPPLAFLHIQVLAFLLTKPLTLVCTTYPAFSLQLYYLHIQRSYIPNQVIIIKYYYVKHPE